VLAALTVLSAFLAGGYYESTYSLACAAVWLGIAAVAALRPVPRPSASVWLLLAFTAWTALSALWGPAGPALRAWPLPALYAGILFAAESARAGMRLQRLAIELVVLTGLFARAAGLEGGRMSWPVTYANGLGVFAVLGLLLTAGLELPRPRLATAACAVLGAAAYLTYSRTALLVGAGAAALLVARRAPAARGIAGAALGVAAVAALDAVGGTSGPSLVPALVLGAGAAFALPPLEVRIPRRLALAAVVALAAVAAFVAQPIAARFAAPAPDSRDAHRLLDVSGHGRADLWRTAWREAADHPLLGGGAGSWPRAYAAQRHTLDGPANAHSLYLETFAELGIVGLALLVAAFATAVRGPPAAVAVLAAFAAATAIDWDWQLPAVTIPALVAAAAGRTRGPPLRASLALAPVALAVGVLAGLHGIGAAVVENGITTESQARLAARLLPYDARPWAFLYAATGSPGALGRACLADAGDLTLKREASPTGGCSRVPR